MDCVAQLCYICCVFPSLLTWPFLCSQALSLKEAEKTVLSDRVSSLQAELSAAALEVDRMSREAAHYKEQEQVMWLPVWVHALISSSLILHKHMRERHQRTFCFYTDQSWGSEQRAAGASLSAGGRSFCPWEGTPQSARDVCRSSVTCWCCSQRGRWGSETVEILT